MTDLNSKPIRSELRKFGLLFAFMLAALFGTLIPWLRFGFSELGLWPVWPWLISTIVALWALLHPASLKLLHTPWMKFATVAQWVNTRIIMLFLFYLVIFPIGLVLKLFGKDSMRRRFDKSSDSYRINSESVDKDHVERPY